MTDAELLRGCIVRTGLSVRQFATFVLGRDERQVRRWLAGQRVPVEVRRWVARLELITTQPGYITLHFHKEVP